MLIRLLFTSAFVASSMAMAATVAVAGHTADDPAAQASSGQSLPAVVRGNTWHLRDDLSSGAAHRSFAYGRSTDFPVFGDWNGDGTNTPGVYRDGIFFLRNSNSSGHADLVIDFGGAGDIPIVGDWDGDGMDEVGFRQGNVWYLDHGHSGGQAEEVFAYGSATDTPIVGDWNGDRLDTPGVVRGNTWYLANDRDGGSADIEFSYGRSGDTPIVGRWGDWGHDHIGIVRGNTWHLRYDFAGGGADHSFNYGSSGDWFVTWGHSGASVSQPEVHYRYTVGTQGDVEGDFEHFVLMAHQTLNHRFGWSLSRDIRYTRVGGGEHFRLWLASPQVIEKAAPTCDAQWSCRVGDDVYINDENWRERPSPWAHRTQHAYRHYLITHEVGHWLGHDHYDCPRQGAPAPVMQQQSISTDGCETNVWPLGWELDQVRSWHID